LPQKTPSLTACSYDIKTLNDKSEMSNMLSK